MPNSVLEKSAKGSVYNILVSGITIILGFTRSIILMRLLAPEPFGLMALAAVFATFITPFTSMGIDNALIQKIEPSRNAFSTHFVLRLFFSFAGLLLVTLISPLLQMFYDPLVVRIIIILMGINLFSATYSTHMVVLRRELRFGTIALLNLAASIAMTITAPLFAFFGAGVWSLVAEQAAGPIIRGLGIWFFARAWHVSFGLDTDEARSELNFGNKVLGSNTLGILLDRFDDFWTGTFLGSIPLGYYSRAYDLAQYPERVLATPITNVFFSAYAAIQEKRQELSKAFFRSSSFLVRAGILLGIILWVVAPQMVVILFTEKWLPIVPVFRIMLIYVILDPFYMNLSYLLVGTGNPGKLLRVRIVQSLVFVASVVALGTVAGIKGVAVAANLMMLTGTLALIILSKQVVSFSIKRLLLWPVVAATTALVFGWIFSSFLRIRNPWISLISLSLLISTVYGVILYVAERKIIHEYTSYILRPILAQLRALRP